jgi:hypothetical protein
MALLFPVSAPADSAISHGLGRAGNEYHAYHKPPAAAPLTGPAAPFR